MLVVLNVADTSATQGNSFYGLAIGFTVAVSAFVARAHLGGGFNPGVGLGATTIGVLAGGGSWGDLWIYLVAPLAASVIEAGIRRLQEVTGLEAAAPPEGEPSPGAPAPVRSAARRTPAGEPRSADPSTHLSHLDGQRRIC